MTWRESVRAAIERVTSQTGNKVFNRQYLIASQLERILREVDSAGSTPEQTLSQILQQLRDDKIIEFIDAGTYRLLVEDAPFAGQKTLYQLAVSDISPNPHNPRLIFDQDELDELKGSKPDSFAKSSAMPFLNMRHSGGNEEC